MYYTRGRDELGPYLRFHKPVYHTIEIYKSIYNVLYSIYFSSLLRGYLLVDGYTSMLQWQRLLRRYSTRWITMSLIVSLYGREAGSLPIYVNNIFSKVHIK